MPQSINPNGVQLPYFEEGISELPENYGIEHSADGGYYPYEINNADTRLIAHFKDSQGRDVRCATREDAIMVIWERALAEEVKNDE